MTDTQDRSGIDRRTVVTGAAWTVPAVMISSALPAYATSKTVTTISVVGISGSPTAVTTFRFDTDDNTDVKAGTTAKFRVTAKPGNNGSGNSDWTAPTLTDTSTAVTITVDPTLAGWSRTMTWTITVQVNTDQPDNLNIVFTLPNLPSKSVVAASVVTGSTTPASNGSVSYTTDAVNHITG